jgi:transcriptional regulator with XRE-family HTH domain
MEAIMAEARNAWIKEALQKRGYKQRDLARNWSVAEGSVTRFISGEENQNLALSKALTLARMLGITIDDLAKGLGMDGKFIEPAIPAAEAASLPPGTLKMDIIGGGKIRLTMCQDLPADVATQVMTTLATSKAAVS